MTDVEPAFSPDGKWIAYSSTEIGGYDVFVQPYPATGARWQISVGGGRQPQWSSKGDENVRRSGRVIDIGSSRRQV